MMIKRIPYLKYTIILFMCLNHFVNLAQKKIYFDSNWEECSKKKASYFRLTEKIDSSTYKIRDYFKNGRIQMTATFSNLKNETKEGVCIWYHKNGKKKTEATYSENKPVGLKTTWDSTHDTINYKPYVDGKLHGLWVTCNNKGDTIEYVECERGLFHGVMKSFFPDGSLSLHAEFKNDKEHGNWIFWRKNGKKDSELVYLNGELNGNVIIYNELGEIQSSTLFESGTPLFDTYLIDSKGFLVYEFTPDNNPKTGKFVKYFSESNQVKLEYDILNGSIHGNYKSHHLNGIIESEGKVSLGFTIGEWRTYNSQGELIDKFIFDKTTQITISHF